MLAALRAADLPIVDLSDGGAHYFVLGNGEAFGGLATFVNIALLRSMVVPGERGSGTGTAAHCCMSCLALHVPEVRARLGCSQLRRHGSSPNKALCR